jgi:hypothetical protein
MEQQLYYRRVVMVQGRTTSGSTLVDKLEGLGLARERLKAILDTLGGHKTIMEVCRELGICEAKFHKLRDHFLHGAVESLEPKKCGRKQFASGCLQGPGRPTCTLTGEFKRYCMNTSICMAPM